MTATESERGAKRKLQASLWVKNVKRDARNNAAARPKPSIACQHRNSRMCSADELTQQDIESKIGTCFDFRSKDEILPKCKKVLHSLLFLYFRRFLTEVI